MSLQLTPVVLHTVNSCNIMAPFLIRIFLDIRYLIGQEQAANIPAAAAYSLEYGQMEVFGVVLQITLTTVS